MADGAGDAVSDYTLTATRFDQVVERYPDGRPKQVIKHRRGDTVTGLSDSEVARLTAAGAIKPKAAAEPADTGDQDTGEDGDIGAGDQGSGDGAGDSVDAAPPSGDPVMPGRTAKTEAWQAYAVARGMDKAEAASKSRTELIAQYGDQP